MNVSGNLNNNSIKEVIQKTDEKKSRKEHEKINTHATANALI